MNPTITVNSSEWIRAATALKAKSRRTVVDFINGQALKVASLALKETHAANAREIERELGAAPRTVSLKTITRGKNTGKTRRVLSKLSLTSDDTFAHRILGARMRATGSFGITRGETIDDKAKELIKARVVSVNFIRSGWIPAIRLLSSVVRKKPATASVTRAGVKMRGRPKGDATPARGSSSIAQARIWNTALNALLKAPSLAGNPGKHGQEGLQRAMDLAARDMIQELARRMKAEVIK